MIPLPKPLGNFDPDDRIDNKLMRSFLNQLLKLLRAVIGPLLGLRGVPW
jgi:hypothetical protein